MELKRQKNTATIITFPIIDADGDTVSGAAGLDSEIDTWSDVAAPDGFTDCSSEATEIGSSGVYYLSLTSDEMNADYIYIQVKTSTTGAKTQHILITTKFAAKSDSSGQVTVGAIANDVITAASIATGAIDADAIADNAIDAGSIASNAITSAKIAADAIGATQIADGAIDAATLASGTITADKFAAGAIDATAIADGAIDAATLASGTITAAKFAAGAIDATAIADGAIDAATLASGTITNAKFAAGAIDAAAIADGAIDRATFAADTGLQSIRSNTAQAGAAGSITLDASASATDEFYTGAWVYLTESTGVGQVRVITAYNGTTKVATISPNWATNPSATSTFAIITAAQITGVTGNVTLGAGAITSSTFATGAIDANAIADNAIDAGAIASNAITSAKIAANAIGASQVADGTIDAATFAAGAIDATAIADNAIDAGAIAADAITAAKIATGAIDADALATDAVTEIWAKACTEPTAVVGASPTAIAALSWLLTLSRNKITQSATTQTLFADDGATTVATSTISDDGTTFTRGEFA